MPLTSTTTTCLRSISKTNSDSISSSIEIALRQFYNLEFKLRLSRVQTQTLESDFELRLKKSFITSGPAGACVFAGGGIITQRGCLRLIIIIKSLN